MIDKNNHSIAKKILLSHLSKFSSFSFGIAGIIFIILTFLMLLFFDRAVIFGSYLISYLFYITLFLGALFFILLHFLTRASWSVVLRRFAEILLVPFASWKGFWLISFLFLPIIFALPTLYPWAFPHALQDPLLLKKSAYLNIPFFLGRAFFFLAIWSWIAGFLRRHSFLQDGDTDSSHTLMLQKFSPLGMILFALTITFSSFDWVMSTDPHWFSSIFGVYFASGAFVGIYALLALFATLLYRWQTFRPFLPLNHLHDLGKLLFGFTVFWAYIAFSQFLLIWYANIPSETIWFVRRFSSGWEYLSYTLIFGHFLLPFFFLLPRWTKRQIPTLFSISFWMLMMHFLDLYWLVMPNLKSSSGKWLFFSSLHLLPLLTSFLGLGAILFALILKEIERRDLFPLNDPRLAESLENLSDGVR